LSSSNHRSEDGGPDYSEAHERTSSIYPGQRPVLAIDTALGSCAAAVYDAGLGETLAAESIDMDRGHAEAIMPMVERVVRTSRVDFEDMERIVTTVGPGSFTGLRVGIAAARGFGLASDKPVVGVSTLDALTAPYVTETETVPIVGAIDARHNNFYLQMIGAGGRKLVTPRVLSMAEAIRSCAIGLVRIIGSGANLLAGQWPASIPAPLLVDARAAPDIVWIARLGARAEVATSPPRPLYLRSPDAKPQDAAKLPRR
jgi:tRNA threonylcarbamoyladenosine biosynthesis protein TsaB